MTDKMGDTVVNCKEMCDADIDNFTDFVGLFQETCETLCKYNARSNYKKHFKH